MSDEERCEFCRFFLPFEEQRNDTEGQCFRYPEPVDKTSFDWCGEFKRVEPETLSRELVSIAEEYAWSTRLRNCLLYPGDISQRLKTLRQLLDCTAEELLKRRHFGVLCLHELQRTLGALGVALRG